MDDECVESPREFAAATGWVQAGSVAQVKVFVVDAQEFRKDWDANGPMVDGLAPAEAVERLKDFQTSLRAKAKWDNFSSGEALLPARDPLPRARKTEKEIEFLTSSTAVDQRHSNHRGLRRHPLDGGQGEYHAH